MPPWDNSVASRTAAWSACLLLAAASFASGPAQAASRVEVRAGSVEADGILAHGVELVLVPATSTAAKLRLYAAGVDGLEAPAEVSRLRLDCASLEAAGGLARCRDGRLSGDFGEYGAQDTAVGIDLARDDELRFRLPGLRLAGGQVSVDGRLRGSRWSTRIEARAIDLEALAGLRLLRERAPAGFALSGGITGTADAAGHAGSLVRLSATLAVDALGFANEAGTLAGEGLAAGLSLELGPVEAGDARRFRLGFESALGQAYVEPVFIDFGEHAVDGSARGRLAPEAKQVSVEHFEVRQAGVGTLDGRAELDLAGETLLEAGLLRLDPIELAGAFPIYVAPGLISTQYADMDAAGRIRGEAEFEAGLPIRMQLALEDVILDSPGGALSVDGLSGDFSWFGERQRNELAQRVDSEVFKSRLAWRAARLWGIEFGPASVPFTTTGRHFRLLDPILIPVFDGGLAIETLRIRHAGTPQMYLRFDAEVRPVSVALVGRALGWPEFSGTLSGSIPRLELADGLVTFGGNIEAKVFDGTVTLRDLRMRDPLGQHPQLFADIDIDGLDLERITNTFEFGMITGRLSGRVEGLEMFAWMPVKLDARLYSTPGDKSPHRISQRAVSNLSSIGGGSGGSVTAALQSGFLRFFDSFRYDRLGLSCRLANDVCRMDGVAPAANGYYIVKGSGLPRIDVIGNQRRVAWTRLVRQLGAITQSSGPVVE